MDNCVQKYSQDAWWGWSYMYQWLLHLEMFYSMAQSWRMTGKEDLSCYAAPFICRRHRCPSAKSTPATNLLCVCNTMHLLCINMEREWCDNRHHGQHGNDYYAVVMSVCCSAAITGSSVVFLKSSSECILLGRELIRWYPCVVRLPWDPQKVLQMVKTVMRTDTKRCREIPLENSHYLESMKLSSHALIS